MSAQKLKIKKGDQVIVTTGKDKGKTGEVLSVLIAEQRVLVKGINVVKKHIKPSQLSAGGIENVERTIHISNVAHIDPKSGNATRVGFSVEKDGTKQRIAKKSGQAIAASAAPASDKKAAAKKKAK
ncbi:MAG: 50S ribosomal protein L24 [Pseudomonadota bacterium]